MSEGKTSLFISHRLASTRFCDRIWLMENGRITEQGSHEELMEKNGAYAGLFEVQGKYYRKEESGKTEAGGNTAEWNQAMKMGGVQA